MCQCKIVLHMKGTYSEVVITITPNSTVVKSFFWESRLEKNYLLC